MPLQECPEEKRLLKIYMDILALEESRQQLKAQGSIPAYLADSTELVEARRAYWEHVEKHGCRFPNNY